MLLLITDGQPHDPQEAIEEANKLKSKGVHLIMIGAGTKKWMSKYKLLFNRIGSKPAHNHIEDFRFLKKITKKLVKDICGNKERQPARECWFFIWIGRFDSFVIRTDVERTEL